MNRLKKDQEEEEGKARHRRRPKRLRNNDIDNPKCAQKKLYNALGASSMSATERELVVDPQF